MTGWNMPSGCNSSDIPGWDAPDPSPLQEEIWKILEDAKMPQQLIEQIDTIISDWEYSKNEPDLDTLRDAWQDDRDDLYYQED